MDKHRELKALATKRQRARWPGYKGIGDYHNGVYECPYVSPYTKTAGNVDADIMVVLQDWPSDEYIRRDVDSDSVTYGYTRGEPTNRNLVRLLEEHFDTALTDIYGTNLFPFIKMGHMGSSIPRRDLVRAAREFALPQITRGSNVKQTERHNTSDAKERLQRARSCLRCALQISICSA